MIVEDMKIEKPMYGKLELTPAELRICSYVTRAYTNSEIAKELNISENTVKHQLTFIFDKLGFSHRLEIALWFADKNSNNLHEQENSYGNDIAGRQKKRLLQKNTNQHKIANSRIVDSKR